MQVGQRVEDVERRVAAPQRGEGRRVGGEQGVGARREHPRGPLDVATVEEVARAVAWDVGEDVERELGEAVGGVLTHGGSGVRTLIHLLGRATLRQGAGRP